MVQLVLEVRHRQPVDHLRGQRSEVTTGPNRDRGLNGEEGEEDDEEEEVQKEPGPDLTEGGGLWVHVHSSQVVWFEDVSAAVDTGQVDDLLPRT